MQVATLGPVAFMGDQKQYWYATAVIFIILEYDMPKDAEST